MWMGRRGRPVEGVVTTRSYHDSGNHLKVITGLDQQREKALQTTMMTRKRIRCSDAAEVN